MITASVASLRTRRRGLQMVCKRILSQVDKLQVYLNYRNHVPYFLRRESKVEVLTAEDFGDMKDAGKFMWADKVEGYHFTLDDDMIYPWDYVRRMIDKIEQYDRKAIVGVHGASFTTTTPTKYYCDRFVFSYCEEVPQDIIVHILGTGTMAYHADTIQFNILDFPVGNMSDIWAALKAQRKQVPMVCIDRTKDWIISNNRFDAEPSIFRCLAMRPDRLDLINAIQSIKKWRFFGRKMLENTCPR